MRITSGTSSVRAPAGSVSVRLLLQKSQNAVSGP